MEYKRVWFLFKILVVHVIARRPVKRDDEAISKLARRLPRQAERLAVQPLAVTPN